MKRAFFKTTFLSSLLAFFLGLFIFIFTKEIILIIAGPNWLGAIPAIKVLSVYGVLRTVFGNFSPLALSVQKQDYVAKMTLFRCIGLAITIIPFTLKYGLVGAGYSALISILIEIPMVLYFLNKIFSFTSIKTAKSI